MDMILATHLSTFDPFKYSGAWYETASIKKGFFGLGQTDCMDTRGIYEYDPDRDENVLRLKSRLRCQLEPEVSQGVTTDLFFSRYEEEGISGGRIEPFANGICYILIDKFGDGRNRSFFCHLDGYQSLRTIDFDECR